MHKPPGSDTLRPLLRRPGWPPGCYVLLPVAAQLSLRRLLPVLAVYPTCARCRCRGFIIPKPNAATVTDAKADVVGEASFTVAELLKRAEIGHFQCSLQSGGTRRGTGLSAGPTRKSEVRTC